MIEEQARVVGLDGRYALVEAAAKSACGACAMGQGCGVSRLGKLIRFPRRTWRVENTAAATLGDDVTLGVPDAALLQAAFLAYMPPLAGLLGGAVLATSAGANQALVALGAVLGLVAGILFSRAQAARLASRFAPRMLGRAERAATLVHIRTHSSHAVGSRT